MLRLIFALALIVCQAKAFAQYTLSGVVQDGKNQPLSGATIEVGGKHLAIANASGRFEVGKLQAGDYSVRVRFVGFKEKVLQVQLTEDTEVNVVLEESTLFTDEVVVRATRADEKSPTTFTTVTKPEIQKQNFGQDLPMLLNWSPSVVTTSDAGAGIGYTGLRIRGSDATRINVTINGIPFNDSESQSVYWVDIPDIASSAESVQIQRGVGTSSNGAGAFGGSINLQTNTLSEDSYGDIIASVGSFNSKRLTVGMGTGKMENNFSFDGRFSLIESDGYIDRASSDLKSYYVSGGYFGKNTILKAIAFGGKEITYQAWYGVPESRLNNDEEAMLATAAAEGWNAGQTENLLTSDSRTFNPYTYKNQVDDYTQNHYQLHFSQRIADSFTANAAFHYTKGRGFYEQFRYDDDFEDYGLPDVVVDGNVVSSSDLVRRKWLDNDFAGVTFSLNYEGAKLQSVLGGAWNQYNGDHYGKLVWSDVAVNIPQDYEYYFNSAEKKDFNIYFKNNYQFSRVNAFIDLQYRTINYQTFFDTNFDVDYHFFNPKAGLVFDLANGNQLYGSVAVSNREPIRGDFVDAVNGSVPKHEFLLNEEFGWRLRKQNYAIQVNGYVMTYKNQLVLTGALNDVGDPIRTNVDKSYRIGIEADATLKFSDKITWSVNLALSRNKIPTFNEVIYDFGVDWDEYNEVVIEHTDTDISFSPTIISGSVFSFFPQRNWEFSLLSKFVGKQYLDNTSNDNRSIDAYFVNDIRVRYSLQPKWTKEISVSLLLNNILNEKYESNGYTWGYIGGGAEERQNYYFPQAGTNMMFMVALKF